MIQLNSSLRAPTTLLTITCAFLCGGLLGAEETDGAKTESIQVDGLTLNVPATWKQEEPKSKMRLTQFRLLAPEGEEADGELAVFSFGGGANIDANLRRWISQFQSDGREVSITSGTGTQGKYVFLDVSGTYNKPDGPPIRRKTVPAPDYRMLCAIQLMEQEGIFFIKATASQETMAIHVDAFRNSFGAADPSTEKALQVGE